MKPLLTDTSKWWTSLNSGRFFGNEDIFPNIFVDIILIVFTVNFVVVLQFAYCFFCKHFGKKYLSKSFIQHVYISEIASS